MNAESIRILGAERDRLSSEAESIRKKLADIENKLRAVDVLLDRTQVLPPLVDQFANPPDRNGSSFASAIRDVLRQLGSASPREVAECLVQAGRFPALDRKSIIRVNSELYRMAKRAKHSPVRSTRRGIYALKERLVNQ